MATSPQIPDTLKLNEVEADFLKGRLNTIEPTADIEFNKQWLKYIPRYQDREHQADYTRGDWDKEGTIDSIGVEQLMFGLNRANIQKIVLAVQDRNGQLYSKDSKGKDRTDAENYELSYNSGIKVLTALKQSFERTADQTAIATLKNELSAAFEKTYIPKFQWSQLEYFDPPDTPRNLESKVKAQGRNASSYDTNFKKADDGRLEIGALYNTTKQYGQRDPLKWSDVVFAAYRDLLAKQPTLLPAKELGQIYQWNITNEQTQATIREIYARNPEYANGRTNGEPVKWHPQADGALQKAFIALMGTPNAVGSGWLLVDHNADLGNKVVACIITSFCQKSPQQFHMWIVYT